MTGEFQGRDMEPSSEDDGPADVREFSLRAQSTNPSRFTGRLGTPCLPEDSSTSRVGAGRRGTFAHVLDSCSVSILATIAVHTSQNLCCRDVMVSILTGPGERTSSARNRQRRPSVLRCHRIRCRGWLGSDGLATICICGLVQAPGPRSFRVGHALRHLKAKLGAINKTRPCGGRRVQTDEKKKRQHCPARVVYSFSVLHG